MCSVPAWATIVSPDRIPNCRERLAEPGRKPDQWKGKRVVGSTDEAPALGTRPSPLGLARPEDFPWRQKEMRTHVVPLAGAAAYCPGHSPPPRTSGGPDDISLGWLRAHRCLTVLAPDWPLRAVVWRRPGVCLSGSPEAETSAGYVVGGSALSCGRRRKPLSLSGLDLPPQDAHPVSCLSSLRPS